MTKAELKSENRITKPEGNPKPEARKGRGCKRLRVTRHAVSRLRAWDFGIRHWAFRLLFFLPLPCCAPVSAQDSVKPLTRLHAHNDYEHKRPLFDALEHGFCSVEADIFLIEGQLPVAHQRSQVKPERTLQKLYLDPLRERVKKYGGRVYPAGPELVLLIDIKTDWKTTYPVLRETLKGYADMLTVYHGDATQTNAVRAIITGNRSKTMFAGERVRYAAYDGELEDLNSDAPASLVPWISSNWARTFHWRGSGPFPQEEQQKLKEILDKAHEHGRRVRFWGAPDYSAFWRELLADGVDLINTDDLDGAQKFLLTQ